VDNRFACAGLRTLCIAERVLDPAQYRAWNARFQKASLSFNGRKTKLDLLAEEIEVDLELLGATGIEDKLQDGVPDTIESLLEAGIKVWVLTGDKRETAINVGKACNLLKSNMITLVISSDTKIATKQRLEYLLGLIAANRWTQLAKEHERDDQMVPSTDEGATSKDAAAVWTKGQPKPSIALVIEGRTLVYALEYDLKFAVTQTRTTHTPTPTHTPHTHTHTHTHKSYIEALTLPLSQREAAVAGAAVPHGGVLPNDADAEDAHGEAGEGQRDARDPHPQGEDPARAPQDGRLPDQPEEGDHAGHRRRRQRRAHDPGGPCRYRHLGP
jgi:hypothetical protein